MAIQKPNDPSNESNGIKWDQMDLSNDCILRSEQNRIFVFFAFQKIRPPAGTTQQTSNDDCKFNFFLLLEKFKMKVTESQS